MRKTSIALAIVLLLPIASHATVTFVEVPQPEAFIQIAASIAPLAGLVEEVGGPHVTTITLLPEGVDPHAASLPVEAVTDAENADLLVFTGHYPWEEDLALQVDTPYITMDDENAMANYIDFGARLSEIPGEHEELVLAQHEHDENPHAWWLLPSNAIAIANTTRAAFDTINGTYSNIWQQNFERFVEDVNSFLDLVAEFEVEYGFSELRAVAVTPAEAYIAETFGIEIEAVLQIEEVLISGAELLEVQYAIRSGEVSLIVGSDVARLQSGGQYAITLSNDYGIAIAWWRAIFFEDLTDYISLMTYNLGVLATAIEGGGVASDNSPVNFALLGFAVILGIVALVEAIVLVLKARSE
ncbi:MAG: metal ABC transporter substrate-binding protein [Candidatus Hodarchaeota archaeon]